MEKVEGRAAREFARLAQIMKRLRSPGGCPWDAEQTPESLKPYLLEETYEVLEAIDADPTHLCEELGDLMLQIVFLTSIFEERRRFDLADVCRGISDKLERRHPHVFDNHPAGDAQALEQSWSRIKAQEKREKGHAQTLFGGIPRQLPALARSQKMVRKADAATAGPPPDSQPALITRIVSALEGATGSGQPAAGIGVAAYYLTKFAECCGVDAELALRDTTRLIAEDLERQAAGSGTLPPHAILDAESTAAGGGGKNDRS